MAHLSGMAHPHPDVGIATVVFVVEHDRLIVRWSSTTRCTSVPALRQAAASVQEGIEGAGTTAGGRQ